MKYTPRGARAMLLQTLVFAVHLQTQEKKARTTSFGDVKDFPVATVRMKRQFAVKGGAAYQCETCGGTFIANAPKELIHHCMTEE